MKKFTEKELLKMSESKINKLFEEGKEKKMKTLEQILAYEKDRRYEDGDYGINACKEAIQIQLIYHTDLTLYTLLETYVKRADEDPFFNTSMVLACWEMINEKS